MIPISHPKLIRKEPRPWPIGKSVISIYAHPAHQLEEITPKSAIPTRSEEVACLGSNIQNFSLF